MAELLSSNDWPVFAGILILQATLLLGAAALASWALRRRPAAERHLVWSVVVAGVIALPLLSLAAPWQVAVPVPGWTAPAERAVVSPAAESSPTAATVHTPLTLPTVEPERPRSVSQTAPTEATATVSRAAETPSRRTFGAVALLVWLVGALAVTTVTLLAMLHLRLVVRRGSELRDRGLVEQTSRICADLGIRRRVRLLEGDSDAMPVTFGILRPVLLLPSAARAWSPERQESVLRHELAHIRRRDTLTQLVADIGCALYWFHPLMWVAARRLRIEREHACDDVVLAAGARASDYAAALLDIARTMRSRRILAPVAIAMAEPTRLRSRITAVLEERTRAERVSTSLLVPFWGGALLLFAAVAAIAPAAPEAAARPIVTIMGQDIGSTGVESAGADRGIENLTGPEDQAVDATSRTDLETPGAAVRSSDEPTCWHERHGLSGTVLRIQKDGGVERSHIIQQAIGGMEVCFRGEPELPIQAGVLPLESMPPGNRLVLATRTSDSRQTLEIVSTAGGLEQSWFVNGVERPFDEAARQWRDVMLELAGGHAAIDRIRGERGRLRGEIGRIRGEEGRLRGEIGRIRGEEGRMRGEIGRIRGEEGRLRGEIGRIRGEEGRLRGEIGRLRGSIASLQSARRATRDEETRARLDAEIEGLRDEIRRVETRIAEYDAAGRIEAARRAHSQSDDTRARIREVERRIEAYDAGSRIREVEARMAATDRRGEIAAIERQIEALDTDRRIAAIKGRLEPIERRLVEIQGRIR